MDFSEDAPPISEHMAEEVEQPPTATQEELEKDFMKILLADARIPRENSESMAQMFADLREKAKEALTQAPFFVPPSSPEESIHQE